MKEKLVLERVFEEKVLEGKGNIRTNVESWAVKIKFLSGIFSALTVGLF